MVMYSPDKKKNEGEFDKHRIVNISLNVCTKTNIEDYVMAMYSPDKSMKES